MDSQKLADAGPLTNKWMNIEDRATQPMEAGGWVSQKYQKLNVKCEMPNTKRQTLNVNYQAAAGQVNRYHKISVNLLRYDEFPEDQTIIRVFRWLEHQFYSDVHYFHCLLIL